EKTVMEEQCGFRKRREQPCTRCSCGEGADAVAEHAVTGSDGKDGDGGTMRLPEAERTTVHQEAMEKTTERATLETSERSLTRGGSTAPDADGEVIVSTTEATGSRSGGLEGRALRVAVTEVAMRWMRPAGLDVAGSAGKGRRGSEP